MTDKNIVNNVMSKAGYSIKNKNASDTTAEPSASRSAEPSASRSARCGGADTLLIGALLLIGAVLLAYTHFCSKAGSVLQVRIDGQTVAEYPMDKDIDIILTGKDGGTNHLIISGGQAWFSEASCPDHLCIEMGRIDKAGQSIICLPNRVSVEVMGGRDAQNAGGEDDGDAQDKESAHHVEQSGGVDAVVGR